MIARSEINRALAKALAFADCWKIEESGLWATRLLALLHRAGVPVSASQELVREFAGEKIDAQREGDAV